MTTQLLREKLSPEFQIMLAGLQSHLKTAPTPDWQTLLRPKLDWSHVLELCQYHEVTPLVYESLKQQAEKLPKSELQNLKFQVIKDKHNSMRLARTMQNVLSMFEDEAIEVIPYKGIVLSQQLFGDIATRPTKDLDFVIQNQDYYRAKRVLREHGFRGPYTGSGKKVTPRQEEALLTTCYHVSFLNCQRQTLELHFRIMPPHRHAGITSEAIWKMSKDYTFFDRSIRTLTYEQLLFVLSMHATNHYWKRLKWLFDSAILLDQGGIGEALPSTAHQKDIGNILLANMALCHHLLALPITESFQCHIARTPFIENLIHKTTINFENWPHKIPDKLSVLLCDLRLSELSNRAKLMKVIRRVLVACSRALTNELIDSV